MDERAHIVRLNGTYRVDQRRDDRAVEASAALCGLGQWLAVEEDAVNLDFPAPGTRGELRANAHILEDIQGVDLVWREGRRVEAAFCRIVKADRDPGDRILVDIVRELSDCDLTTAFDIDCVALKGDL